jgi:diguanylate cyclase (GGDEF)-like protein
MLEPEDELESSEEPRKEFDFLLNRVLMVIRSVIPARTAAFFWFNKEKQQLVLEAKITDAPEDMTEKRKLPIGHDVVSQIALEGRPEILTQISPAAVLDLLPYYKYKSGTKSFVGVPVYFKGNVVGVLCADAAEEDAYTDVTIGFFGHFTKLISGLVTSYTTKFDLHQSARKLDALTMFKEQSLDANTEADVIEALFDTVIHFVEVSTIGVCTYDKDRKMWTIGDARSVVEGYGDLVGSAVDLDSTLIGDCVHSGEIVAESSPERTRVTDEEYSLEGGQFVGIPLRSEERTYGALFIENLQASISNQDFALTELLGDMAGDMIERLRQRDQLASGAIVESDTDLLNREGVHRRLKEEFARSTDYQSPFSVCLIQVDPIQAASDNGTQAHELVIRHLTTRVREQLRDYDIVGRMDGDTLVIGLPAYHSQEAQYWVEGLRRDIASSPLDIGGKRTSATISVGIAEANPEDTWDSLLTHASAALNISAKQQNKVTVFS